MFSEQLKTWRKFKGLSQADLAKASGVPVKTIQHWEQGSGGSPRLDAVVKIAQALGIKVSQLIGEEGENGSQG